MIVIPMLGRSTRFFDAGYTVPKFQLALGGETVFAKSLRSFEQLFGSEHFLFIVRSDYNAKKFVAEEVTRLGLSDFRIIEMQCETRGQAQSVMHGTIDYEGEEPLIVFNIDTIRHNFSMPTLSEFGDGFLEVFTALGDGWSFVEPADIHRVARTTEKERISELCSNGLYGFARLLDFRAAYTDYDNKKLTVLGELYIAPLYNFLIEQGSQIMYRIVDNKLIEHCGIPEDYELLKRKFG